jgi:multidrug efflux pump subunit AcrA (membrane-fusion protein)
MRRALPIVLLLALSVAACGGRRARGPAPPDPPRTTVRVQNQNFLDMNVYVLNGSQRVRLGTVSGVSTRVFTIPSNLVFGMASLRFMADPVGSSQAPISQEISVRAGDQVQLTIPNY